MSMERASNCRQCGRETAALSALSACIPAPSSEPAAHSVSYQFHACGVGSYVITFGMARHRTPLVGLPPPHGGAPCRTALRVQVRTTFGGGGAPLPGAPLRRNGWVARVTPGYMISSSWHAQQRPETAFGAIAKVDVEGSNPFQHTKNANPLTPPSPAPTTLRSPRAQAKSLAACSSCRPPLLLTHVPTPRPPCQCVSAGGASPRHQ